jgi:2-amino-4-hydroxy-6-hydroxymethyldihydropteridine diphosphokinase
MKSLAVIALGANLGERAATLSAASRAIGELPGTTVAATSKFYESAAVKLEGVDMEAPEYLNAVVLIDTDLLPDELLSAIAEIELQFGRVRHERWGDRTLDLDIVAFDRLQHSDDRLTLPHPRAHERSFVLVPWLEVDPLAELPQGKVAELVFGLAHEVRPYQAEAVE